MSDKDLTQKSLTPKNMSRLLVTRYNTKQQNTQSTFRNNKNITFSSFLNLEENNKHDLIQEKKNSYCLVVKKLNLKESKNNYYSKALKNIFLNPEHYLEKFYEGKKIIIGKEHHLVKDNKDTSEVHIRQNKKRKTITASKNNSKTSLLLIQKSARNSKSLSSNKLQEIDKYTTGESSRSNRIKKDLRKFDVSDGELKLIYKEVAERELKNKQTKIDFFLNQSWGMGVGRMLELQENILKTKKQKYRFNEKLSNRIMNVTFKERNRILMNEKKDLLVLNTKPVDRELTKFSIFNKNLTTLTKNWLYNLRKDNKKEEQKNLDPIYKEIIYYNREYNNDLDSFNSSSSIKEKFFKKNYRDKIFRKNKSEFDLNSFHSLYIQGKHLLNQEIKITKELMGKKKKLLQYNFNPKEISSIMYAQSNQSDTMNTPRAVANSMEIHKFK